jgi:hypothetical protein
MRHADLGGHFAAAAGDTSCTIWRKTVWPCACRKSKAWGLVSIAGGQRPAVRVQGNAHALAVAGLSLEDVRNGHQPANVNMAKGSLDGAATGFEFRCE